MVFAMDAKELFNKFRESAFPGYTKTGKVPNKIFVRGEQIPPLNTMISDMRARMSFEGRPAPSPVLRAPSW